MHALGSHLAVNDVGRELGQVGYEVQEGSLDAQLLEKCSSNFAHGATDIRFLQALGSALVQIPMSPESLDAKQHEAQLAREKAELEEAKVLVSREENKWLKQKADVQASNANLKHSVQRSRRRRNNIRQSLSKRGTYDAQAVSESP